MTDVVGMGEAMVLLEAERPGLLEHAARLVPRVAGTEMNLCAAVARLGLKSSFCSRVGDDPWGRKVVSRLEELCVGVGPVAVDPGAPTGVFFKEVLPDGERRVHYYREGSAASRLTAEDGLRAAQARPGVLVVSGITLALGEGPVAAVEAAVRSAKETGAWVALDPNLRAPLGGLAAVEGPLGRLLPLCDVLLAGLDEAEAMFGASNPQDLAEEAHEAGAREVVFKDGARGCWYEEGGRMLHLPAEPVEQVDPVGAGDAFGGGYLAARLRGAVPEASAGLGARLGALVAASAGDTEGLPEPRVGRAWLGEALLRRPRRRR